MKSIGVAAMLCAKKTFSPFLVKSYVMYVFPADIGPPKAAFSESLQETICFALAFERTTTTTLLDSIDVNFGLLFVRRENTKTRGLDPERGLQRLESVYLRVAVAGPADIPGL